MEHLALLVLLLVVIAGGVFVVFKRTSKRDRLEDNPLRGTTRPRN